MKIQAIAVVSMISLASVAAEYRDVDCGETPFPMPKLKEWIPPSATFSIADYGAV